MGMRRGIHIGVCVFAVMRLPVSGQTATMDRQRAANLELLNSIRSLSVSYISEVEVKPGEKSIEDRLATIYKEPSVRHEAARVVSLNCAARNERVALHLRAHPLEWVMIFEDLRDLRQIAEVEKLSLTAQAMLDKSRVVLSGEGIRGYLIGRKRDLVLRRSTEPGQRRDVSGLLRGPVHFGLINDELLDGCSEISVSEAEEIVDVPGILRQRLKSEKGQVVLEVDPQKDYRFRKLKVYSAGGQLTRECVAEDYRLVDGIWFPFEYEERGFNVSGEVMRREKLIVERVEFNRELPADALRISIPAGTMVHVSEGNASADTRLTEQRVMGTAELKALVDSLIERGRP